MVARCASGAVKPEARQVMRDGRTTRGVLVAVSSSPDGAPRIEKVERQCHLAGLRLRLSPLRPGRVSRCLVVEADQPAVDHHFTMRPTAVRLHQQSGSQPHVRFRGL